MNLITDSESSLSDSDIMIDKPCSEDRYGDCQKNDMFKEIIFTFYIVSHDVGGSVRNMSAWLSPSSLKDASDCSLLTTW